MEHKTIRIGILIRDFNSLRNYELRIIQNIINDPNLELALLIKDGRQINKKAKDKFVNNIISKNAAANILFKMQCALESKMFPVKATIDKQEVIKQLNKVNIIELNPQRKGFLDIFSNEDSMRVEEHNLDIILRHEFNIIRGNILNSAKHGIWSFHHGDNSVNRGGPAGFWEIVLNEKCVGVTLQQLTPKLDGGNIIDKAYFNWNFSHISTQNDIYESSVSLLFKNINKLKHGEVEYKKSLIYYNPLYKKPSLKYVLIYLVGFYGSIFDKVLYRIIAKIFNKRKFCWSLYASNGLFIESQLFSKKEITLPKNEFWADPFLFKYKDQLYAFFENYEYSIGKGKISCAKIIDGKFVDVCDVLNLPYHLSYPFITQEGDGIYMIPETSKNRKLEIYKCVSFPNRWELFSTSFEGEEIVDTTYFKDDNGDKWLFLNKGYLNKPELHIYKIDSLKLETVVPHISNPVKIDTLSARNAGSIFKYEGDYYRPSQLNSNGFYGNGLNLNKIVSLNTSEYIEDTIVTVKPNFTKKLVGLHHLHQMEDYFIFDVCRKLK